MTKHAMYELAEFKALPDEEAGTFEAIVSVFGNVDHQGDRVVEGAFTNSIAEWKASGSPIPVIWSHQWGDPNAHIGSVDPSQVEEIPGKGLKVAGQIDLDDAFAAKVYRLLKERRVKEFSFAYDVVKEKKNKDDGANDLLELKIFEVGPTLKGANPSTELLGVKAELVEAAGQKAGRALSKSTEALIRTAHDALGKVLESVETDDAEAETSEGKATRTLLDLQAEILKESNFDG
jgi:HK97 family phage prohead protease